jgi:hypothetical protein
VANNLLRELPESLGSLVGLKRLKIEGNALSTLPASISKLKQLNILCVAPDSSRIIPIGAAARTVCAAGWQPEII